MNHLRRQNSRPQQTFERWTLRTHESPRELARQSEAKRKQAPQSEANVCRRRRQRMQSRKNLPYKLHRTSNIAQKTKHKLGVAFSYLERNNLRRPEAWCSAASALGHYQSQHKALRAKCISAIHWSCFDINNHAQPPYAYEGIISLSPGSKIVGKASRGKLRENCMGARERRSSEACKDFFQYLILGYL